MNVTYARVLILCVLATACAERGTVPFQPGVNYTPPEVSEPSSGPLPPEFVLGRNEETVTAAPIEPDTERTAPPAITINLDKLLPGPRQAPPVSLNLRRATVETAIRVLGEAAGFNFLIHPDVQAKRSVDLVLENAPWLEALESIVRSNNLAASVRGVDIFSSNETLASLSARDVIVISSYENLVEEQERRKRQAENVMEIAQQHRRMEQERALARRMGELREMVTKSYRLKYADPVEALDYMKTLYSGQQAGPGGRAVAYDTAFDIQPDAELNDPAAAGASETATEPRPARPGSPPVMFALYRAENMITVTAPPKTMVQIMAQLKEIDVMPRQVSIEARIVEIQRNYLKDLGLQWGGYRNFVTNQTFPNTIGIAGGSAGTRGTAPNAVSLPPQSAVDATTGEVLADAPGGVIGITMAGLAGSAALHARLFALESAGVSRTLSNPKILALNGGVAVIKSGREIPFQASSANTGVVIRFREAVISLVVKPLIMADDRIRLTIRANKDEVDPSLSVQGTPAIKKKELFTSVVVENGGSAALGGMFESEDSDFEDRVPWFHRLPVLGWLFKNKRKVDNQLELLVFITPTIIGEAAVQ